MVRVGRSLWPRYIEPLNSANIEKSLDTARRRLGTASSSSSTQAEKGVTKGVENELLSLLDQRIRPQFSSKLELGLYTLTEDNLINGNASTSFSGKSNAEAKASDSMEQTSYLTKCLMLAAFICQSNKADRDRHLFTIQKNGKRNNANKRKSPEEDIAYGTARATTAKSFRPRLFPMERMLSVFISIFGLNRHRQPGQSSRSNNNSVFDISPSTIGTSELSESLSHLRDIGVLQDNSSGIGASSTINLVSPKYWCTLTREEADTIAKSVKFPLENYLF